jgi:hypothetical protein
MPATAPRSTATLRGRRRRAAEGEERFRSEEELLFPAYAREGDVRHPLLERPLGADELLSLARELARPVDPGVPGAGD